MNDASVLGIGERAPVFVARTASKARYAFDTVAGRYVVLLFYGAGGHRDAAQALRLVGANRDLFDDERACFFGVSTDPADEGQGLTSDVLPGVRHFLDFDLAISRAFNRTAAGAYRPGWLVLDPTLRVLAQFPIERGDAAIEYLRCLPPPDDHAGADLHAPALIELYDRLGGEDSGFVRDVDGKTTLVVDHAFKRRADLHIDAPVLRQAIASRIKRRLGPELRHAFQFAATRMERYLVACYDAGSGGHFRPHRDNTTKGTAHRRFAVTINLNSEAYDGGDLSFPEYGARTYRAPTGGAVVFSCSLLHEARPVLRGRRYAFLPFLYDEAAAAIREENNRFLHADIGAYSRDAS